MPDFATPGRMDAAPQNWGEAFATLPMEAPGRDAWARVSAALDARRELESRSRVARSERRVHWGIGLASAAVLALVLWSPLFQWWQPASDGRSPPTRMAVNAPGARGPAAPALVPRRDEAEAAAIAGVGDGVDAGVGERTRALDEPARIAATDTAARKPTASSSRPSRTAGRASPVRAASAPSSTPALDAPSEPIALDAIARQEPAHEQANSTPAPTGIDPLRQLQSRSAQLEALVAMARDDRAGSASTALLGSELDATIAAIDATLSQPDLAADQRTALWQQRVETLQQLAGLETTERWLASQGALYDAALVSVD